MRKKIIIITTGWFPEGDAGAVRLKIMGKIFTECGYEVTVLCRGMYKLKGNIDNIEYISLRNFSSGLIIKILDYIFFSSRVKNILKNNVHSIYGIYIYNAHENLFKFCKNFSLSNKIKLYHDCVEWYSPEEYRFGKYDPWYRLKNRINTKIIDKSFSVISISTFLEEYFLKKGIFTVKVPILCDFSSVKNIKKFHPSKVVIFYGGSPGKKDLIGNLLEGALMLNEEEKKRIHIILIGATKEYLINVSDVSSKTIKECEKFLEIHGRMPRSEVLKRMEIANFVFLARDSDLRYAKAGFPSKVVEALAHGTPMLCNISSDLDDYLINEYNSIIMKDHTPESVYMALKKILKLTLEQKKNMSLNAVKTAKEKFDYHNYIPIIKEFINR